MSQKDLERFSHALRHNNDGGFNRLSNQFIAAVSKVARDAGFDVDAGDALRLQEKTPKPRGGGCG